MLLALQNQLNLGASGPPSFSLAKTEGADTLSANVSVIVSFSSSVTEGSDTLSSTVNPWVTTSLAVTEGADTLASTVNPLVSASLAVTEGADTLSASVNPWVTITLSQTEGADTLSSTITISAANPSFSLAATEGADTLSATVDVVLNVSLGMTEGSDALTALVDAWNAVALSATDGADTLTSSITIVGDALFSADITEGNDLLDSLIILPQEVPTKVGGDDTPRVEYWEGRKGKKAKDKLEESIRDSYQTIMGIKPTEEAIEQVIEALPIPDLVAYNDLNIDSIIEEEEAIMLLLM